MKKIITVFLISLSGFAQNKDINQFKIQISVIPAFSNFNYSGLNNYLKDNDLPLVNSGLIFTPSFSILYKPFSDESFFMNVFVGINTSKTNKNTNFKNKNKNQYSILKKKNEKMFNKLKSYGVKISIARCFAFVGKFLPRNSNYVVGNFIESILKNRDILIKSNHDVFRSYMYADDLVRWLIKIVENSNVNCPTYNVGSENTVNIHKFGSILAKKYNLNCPVGKIDKKKYDMYVPSTNKIKEELNLIAKFNSLQAVNKTINLLKQNEKN
jgi:nucleoside-diphosphate-sugar epimerase